MGQLGYALTGAAQGLASGMQYKNEQKEKKRREQADKDRLDYQKTKDADEKAYREGQVARDDLSRVEGYLNDPNANKKYTPEQLASFEAKRKAIYARHPDLDPGQVAPAADLPYGQGTGSGEPLTPPPAATPSGGAPDMTPADLFDLQQQNKPQPAPDPLQSLGVGSAPAFNPMGIQPDMPERPLANPGVGITGTQNLVHAGSFPPNPFPQPPPAPPQPPAGAQQGPVQGPQAPLDPQALRMQIVQRILGDKTNITPAQIADADARALEVLDHITSGDLQGAQAALARVQTAEVGPNAASQRGLESAQTNILIPSQARHEDLAGQAALLAARAKNYDPKLQVEILRLQHEVQKDTAAGNIAQATLSLQAMKGLLDQNNAVADRSQRQGAIDFNQGHATQGPAFQTFLSTLGRSLVTVDKYTGQVTSAPGWEQKYIQSVKQYQKQTGQAPSMADSNPGFDPSLWDAVSKPGFNLQTTLSALARSGDKRARALASQYKAADAAAKARSKVQ